MISVSKHQVPEYLRSSPLFKNAFAEEEDSLEDPTTIEIPADCFKLTPEVTSESDLFSLLQTIRFWLIPEYIENRVQVLQFLYDHRESLAPLVAEFGPDFPHLMQLCKVLEPSNDITVLGNAVKLGSLILIKNLRSICGNWAAGPDLHVTSLAAQGGHLDCLQYMLDNGCELHGDECRLAAQGGHVDCLKFAYERGCPVDLEDEDVCKAALRSNSLPCLKYLLDTVGMEAPWNAMNAPARRGNIKMLGYLLSKGCELEERVANVAAASNQLVSLQYLHRLGCSLTGTTLQNAIHNGSLECLQYLHEVGEPWDEYLLHDSRGGVIKPVNLWIDDSPTRCPERVEQCLFYAAEHGCPVTSETYAFAVKRDLSGFVQYLCDHGVECSATAMLMAVKKGHIACLRVMLDHGCPVAAPLTHAAASGGHLDCLRLLLDRTHSCEPSANMTIEQRRLECLRCLHKHGIAFDVDLCRDVIRANSLDCVKFLVEHGCPMDTSLPVEVVRHGSLIMLRYLHNKGCPWDARTTAAAVQRNNDEMFACAVNRGCPVDVTWRELNKAPKCKAFMVEHKKRTAEKGDKKRKATEPLVPEAI